MALRTTVPRFAIALATVLVTLVATTALCTANTTQPVYDEPRALTEHPVGDTIARGIEFVLRPMHTSLSNGYFKIVSHPAPRRITTIRLEAPPSQEQAQP